MSRHEHAAIISEGASLKLARRIADWIVSDERRGYSWVVGVYGARGAGKTSVLLTLLDILRQHEHAGRLALPTAAADDDDDDDDSSPGIRNLLKPADLRDHDDLIFELLRHLHDRYAHQPSPNDQDDPFHKAREIEVQRQDIDRFLRYEEEVGVSRPMLRKSNIEIRKAVASSTIDLKAAFKEIILRLRGKDRNRALVIFVDDLDLHPERTLQLLEIFHIFLDQPRVVIVLAADKPLLLDGIELGLDRDRNLENRPHLAAALLAKYVPYEWHLPIPTESDRFDFLWPELRAEGELKRWWPSEKKYETVFNDKFRRIRRDVRQFAKAQLSPILPPTYRGLKAFENRLDMVRQTFQFNESGYVVIPSQDGWLDELKLDEILLPAFMSAVIAIDLQHPGLALWNHVRLHPADVMKGLDELARSRKLREESLRAPRPVLDEEASKLRSLFESFQGAIPENDTEPPDPFDADILLFKRVGALNGIESYMTEVYRMFLRHLADVWKVLQSVSRTPHDARFESDSMFAMDTGTAFDHTPVARTEQDHRTRFLCVSANADAMRMAEPEWKGRYSQEEVEEWHVDLDNLIRDANHATRDELVTARERAAAFLDAQGIPSFSGGVEVFLKANLPFAAWLGWYLRYLQRAQAFNWFQGTFTQFPGPDGKLPFENAGRFELMDADLYTGDGAGNHAVVIIDLLELSQPGQLDAFHDEHGDSVAYGQGVRLSAHLGSKISPEYTEPFLRDCIELLGQLRREGITHVHLGLAMPDNLAFLLGQQLHARVDRISLYEYRRTPGIYEYIFDLEENE